MKRKGNWKETELKPILDNYGYYTVNLYKNGKNKRKAIHRILAETFIENPENLPTVDHLNRNKEDNRIENLRWANYSTQNNNKDTTYAPKNLKNFTKKGEDNPRSKTVIQYDLQGNIIAKYGSIREAERITKIRSSSISNCCKGKQNTTGGFKWEYV